MPVDKNKKPGSNSISETLQFAHAQIEHQRLSGV